MSTASPRPRRPRRTRLPLSQEARTAAQHDLARRAVPTVGFFGYSLLAGLLIALAAAAPGQPLGVLLLGVLLTPLMAPVVGLALGLLVGAPRMAAESLGALLIGSALVLGPAALVRLAGSALGELSVAAPHPLSAVDALLAIVGALGTAQWLLRNDPRVYLANALLAYALYLPLAHLGLGHRDPWLQLLWLHLLLALLGSLVALWQMGFRPARRGLAGVLLLSTALMLGAGVIWSPNDNHSPAPAATSPVAPLPITTPPSVTPAPTATLTQTPSPSPTFPPTATFTPTLILVLPSPTATVMPSASPTPQRVYALVHAPEEYGGAYIREAPGFNAQILGSVANGTLVEVVGDLPVEAENATWVEVYVPSQNLRGWMVQALLLRATPAPLWEP